MSRDKYRAVCSAAIEYTLGDGDDSDVEFTAGEMLSEAVCDLPYSDEAPPDAADMAGWILGLLALLTLLLGLISYSAG